MSDIIQLLPESVANQIAAGEVIQRPASVVKELLENAVDSGASRISVIIKDAGKTLIQVIDDGSGMSETDARMAFERHATSKIRKADDLYAIRSMGFRGEALASVAAVAEVTLLSKREENELGTEIVIRATELISQEPVACNKGSNIAVKNLFFNVPARRKFLKSDTYEFRLIISELQRIALAFPDLEFNLQHNNNEIFNLTACNFKQRIIQIFGKAMNLGLIDIKTNTTLIKIFGYISKIENTKKSHGEQFFFVNNRFMRHPYFHKALMNAYERLITPDSMPSYFIFFEVDPEKIDVNIHPTKTEIKFEDEQAIWQILHATIKESLGKFSVAPTLDFDAEMSIEIPVLSKNTHIRFPSININPDFNPFETDEFKSKQHSSTKDYLKNINIKHWENLYSGFENEKKETPETVIPNLFDDDNSGLPLTPVIMQLKNKYILIPIKSGLMIVDQKRAHERILYENFMETLSGTSGISQQSLFPQVIELSAQDHNLLMEYLDEINHGGFDIRDFGSNSIVVNGCPANISNPNPKELIEKIILEISLNPPQPDVHAKEFMALVLSKASAIPYGKMLSSEEMRELTDKLFGCANHNFSPDGKPVISIISIDEFEKKLK